MITPVSIATTTATQTETEVFNSNIAATQTEAEEVNVRALLDKTEERLGEHILCSVQLPGQEQVIAIQRLLSVSQRQVVQGVLYYSALHFFFQSRPAVGPFMFTEAAARKIQETFATLL